jgi:hypothetical protein
VGPILSEFTIHLCIGLSSKAYDAAAAADDDDDDVEDDEHNHKAINRFK